MKRLVAAALAATALCMFAGNTPAAADEVKLLFADVVPPSSIIDAKVVQPWAQKVNAEGKGVLSIDVRPGPTMASFENVYDRVLADAPAAAFHFAKPLKSVDTTAGDKLIVPNKGAGDALQALGCSPLSLN